MDDARAVLYEDIKERNAMKRGAYHQKRGGGRHVKMPSDFLTRKELNALNGEVQAYRLNEPMTWQQFRWMPEDIQRQYIMGLDAKYHPTNAALGKMLGVSGVTTGRWRKDKGVPQGTEKFDSDGWELFLRGVKLERPAEQETTEETQEETPESRPQENAAETPQGTFSAGVDNFPVSELSALLTALKGTGARITLEVTL